MSRDVVIRPLSTGDADGFRRLMAAFYRHAGNELPSVGDMDRLLAKALAPEINLVFLVALSQSELVGMLSLTFGESSYKVSPFAWCDDFFVEPKSRGAGIGRALIEEATKLASSRGCSNILLGVGNEENEALAFYASVGFVHMRCELLTLPLASDPIRYSQ